MKNEIVGRDEELEIIRAFLARDDESRALVLEGEAGIGKSTLWSAAVETARERSLRVLSSRPAEAERGLALAGLGDLFEDVLGDVLPELSAPRRRALEVALLLDEATTSVDPRALGVAVRNTLEILAADEPIVLAVDDVQWLDPSTTSALSFALRRLRVSVLLILAQRVGEGTEISPVERSFDAHAVERLPVGPLSVGATQLLLGERLGRIFTRPTLLRIHETSGGNPFYALEVARALGPDVDPTHPLPIPETLEGLVSARLAGLPKATREALVLAAAVGSASPKLLRAAGAGEDVLEPALAARVVELVGGNIRFTHPILASVLYQGLPPEERRRAHRALAAVVVDPLERARHLALSTEGRDPEIAAALDEAAALAGARGTMIAAAELSEHALRLTPVEAREDERRRIISAGRAHLAAGEAERARRLGDALEARSLEGRERVEALIFLSELESGRMRERIALRREALREASIPPHQRLLLNQRLALEVRFTEGVAPALEHAWVAIELSEQSGDDALRGGALAALAMLDFTAGEPGALRLAEEACELATAAGDPQRLLEASFCLAHILVWSVELARARELLERLHRQGSERDERVSAQALWYLSVVELRGGHFDLAAEHAERARELSVQYGRDDTEDPQNLFTVALAAAYRGELQSAHALAQLGCRLADEQDALLPGLEAVLGLAGVWSGDAAAGSERFAAAEQTADDAGWLEPGLRWWRVDHVEALLERERADEAVSIVDDWEDGATRLDRTWVLANVTHCRGLVAAAATDVVTAVSLFESAAAMHEAVGDSFGRARAQLALGVVRRRLRLKRRAREAIEEALAGFEESAAVGWEEKARAELGHIGGRVRERGLTPAEQRVAALVAEGRTNREVAAALFLGERTVETHLTHVYAKLGIRSRTELARRLN